MADFQEGHVQGSVDGRVAGDNQEHAWPFDRGGPDS
jgi:hypothetical protein